MDFERLTKLVEQRKHSIEAKELLQKQWDKAAEEMNQFGEAISEVENRIKHLEQKIRHETANELKITLPTYWKYWPARLMMPSYKTWCLGTI